MALFQVSVLKKYLKLQDEKIIDKAYKKFISYFQHPEIQENIRKSKEEQFQATFLSELFVNILGYKLNPNPNYNLTTEFKNESNNRKADGAILKQGNAIGVIELKGTNTKHLEGIRQQAFDYKANQKNCVYVITSNFEKLRFYINDATEFLEFDLFELNRNDFGLLWLCLYHDNIMNGLPLKIKEASHVEEEIITKEFYKDYSVFKRELYRDLVKKNAKDLKLKRQAEITETSESGEDYKTDLKSLEKNVKLNLFKKSQKLIDRFLFIFFAEDRGLLSPNSIHKIIQNWEMLQDMDVEQSLYERYKIYFNHLNTGRDAKGEQTEIFAYNGGLFKPDPILDMLKIDNELLLKHTKKLATYDFESQVDVNILGHIFENSLNEIESVNAEIEGADFDKQKSKRKKDGVFYTPKYITKYIVENTVGRLCEEKKTELGFREEEYFKGRKRRQKSTLEGLLKILDDYREWLLKITICDPACGSGAFLNQALDFLIREHHYIDEMRGKLLGESFRFPGIENTILENNIYGVDINDESVEIARLSLWLRTAKPHRKLNDLSTNIKCGNSLIEDKKIAGIKAFQWEEEFPEVFKNGGFDVIIGNPPYVFGGGSGITKEEKVQFKKQYVTGTGKVNLFTLFIEKGFKLLKKDGGISYIIPNTFLRVTSYNPIRKFLLSKYQLTDIVDLGAGVFDDAVTSAVIFVSRKTEGHQDSKTNILKNFIGEHTSVLQNFFVENDYIITTNVTKEQLKVLDLVTTNSLLLGDLCKELIFGVVISGNKDELVVQEKIDGYKPFLEGKDIGRYTIKPIHSYLNYIPEKIHRARSPKIFESQEKLLIQRITGGNRPLKVAYDNQQYYNKESINNLILKDSCDYNIKSLLAILNSRLLSWFYSVRFTNESTLTVNLSKEYLSKIPISRNVKVENKSLSDLATKMIEKSNELSLFSAKFQSYLTNTYSRIDINTKMEYWYEIEFGEFINELNKAIKKTNRERLMEGLEPVKDLTKKDEFEWMELFEENKKKAVELQQQIDETDRKIDQMVYELYGLTEDEINIVENK